MWISKLILKICFLLFIASFFILSISSELCNPVDKRALLQIKQSLGNPYLIIAWSNDTDCCTQWNENQVVCDPTTHRVTSLMLFSYEISGQIPAAVGDLPYLQTLVLRKLINITGPIPEAIGKLNNLRFVRFSWNNLTGPVPSFLSRLKKLEYLDLAFNSLSGSIPPSLSQLPNLSTLHLDRNQLTGSIPKSFGSLKQGNFYIYLSHNRLSGSIPPSLDRVNFTVIDFSRNQLTGDASFLFGKDELQQIDLSRNLLEFNMSKVKLYSNLSDSNLIAIDLNHNKIYGSLPPSLAELPALQLFNVSYNRLCGPIPVGVDFSRRFDQYSFVHNKCLCGGPLPPCK